MSDKPRDDALPFTTVGGMPHSIHYCIVLPADDLSKLAEWFLTFSVLLGGQSRCKVCEFRLQACIQPVGLGDLRNFPNLLWCQLQHQGLSRVIKLEVSTICSPGYLL